MTSFTLDCTTLGVDAIATAIGKVVKIGLGYSLVGQAANMALPITIDVIHPKMLDE